MHPLPTSVLFLGTCRREKGLFDTLEAVALAHTAEPGGFVLTVAGAFVDPATEREFQARLTQLPPGLARHVGFADEAQKHTLFAGADVLCLPSAYPHEAQPLVIAEALAHGVPVIATRWRALPGMLPAEHARLVDPARPDQIAQTLLAIRREPPPLGELRAHYLAHFTPDRHLKAMKAALFSIRG
jgi:glycosyltransferase involved in cell wall biosynthesis